MNPLNHMCFYIAWILKLRTFFQCVSLIELNAQEDEWFVAIEILQEEKRKTMLKIKLFI